MDRNRRASRLPTPRLPFRRRRPGISISEPIGPVQHNKFPVSSYDESHWSQDVLDVDPSPSKTLNMETLEPPVAIHSSGNQDPATRPVTPIVRELEESTPHWLLPKSCTFNVLSGIPKSFSRSSLIPSRRTATSSTTSSLSGATNTSFPSVSKASTTSRVPVSKGNRWSLGSSKSDLHLSRDPYIIYEAQPSAYWTGRFVALRDKFQSESLTPKNMQSLIIAHTEHTMAINQQERCRKSQNSNQVVHCSRYNTRLPPSATSGAILQTSGNMSHAIAHAEAALLLDDDERCKRVLLHMEAFCATDEARNSLRLWQQDYARKTGSKKLLPEGCFMEERVGGSYLAKLMGGRGMGKRASIM